MNETEIFDFLNKIINNFKSKIEIFDDILKITHLPNYPSTSHHLININNETNLLEICLFSIKDMALRTF